MRPRRFKAPYIRPEHAWARADDFRRTYWPAGSVPIEVEEILWHLNLRLEPLHSLKEDADVDALLRGDLTTIIVDADEYMDDRMQNRMRFSLAHELGHFVLHADVYRDIQHQSVDEWIAFVDALPDDQWGYMKQHANECAGRLLVPPDRLGAELHLANERAREAGFMEWEKTGDAALDYIATGICRVFGVSDQVIAKRLRREGLWPIS